jgi:hypothetical protein
MRYIRNWFEGVINVLSDEEFITDMICEKGLINMILELFIGIYWGYSRQKNREKYGKNICNRIDWTQVFLINLRRFWEELVGLLIVKLEFNSENNRIITII